MTPSEITEERLDEYKREIQELENLIEEYEYALVGGNLIKEDITWELADDCFRRILGKLQSLKGI